MDQSHKTLLLEKLQVVRGEMLETSKSLANTPNDEDHRTQRDALTEAAKHWREFEAVILSELVVHGYVTDEEYAAVQTSRAPSPE
jgi:hypothetical protein